MSLLLLFKRNRCDPIDAPIPNRAAWSLRKLARKTLREKLEERFNDKPIQLVTKRDKLPQTEHNNLLKTLRDAISNPEPTKELQNIAELKQELDLYKQMNFAIKETLNRKAAKALELEAKQAQERLELLIKQDDEETLALLALLLSE